MRPLRFGRGEDGSARGSTPGDTGSELLRCREPAAYIAVMHDQRAPQALSDDELLHQVVTIVGRSRSAEASLLAHLAEVDARRLFAREAFDSMFAYCVRTLHFSEAEAFLRIAAARACRRHPLLLVMLGDGRLHLSAIARLAPLLTEANADAVLARAVHRTKRQIEELIAELAPRPDAPALVRKLPERGSAGRQPAIARGQAATPPVLLVLEPLPAEGKNASPCDALCLERVGPAEPAPRAADGSRAAAELVPPGTTSRARVEATAPGRYKVQFTASAGLRDKLERLQEMMRDSTAGGDLAAVIEQAVTEKLERLEARRFGRSRRPRAEGAQKAPRADQPTSRHIPAEVRRAVHARDGGCCSYRDSRGRVCGSRRGLEYHHRHPFGYGGGHDLQNVCLRCSVHHRLLTEADHGAHAVTRSDRVRDDKAADRAEPSGLASCP